MSVGTACAGIPLFFKRGSRDHLNSRVKADPTGVIYGSLSFTDLFNNKCMRYRLAQTIFRPDLSP
ncbi:hypothetical protein D1AOALGA4SA_7939 [Olavius algarvensis Delta 1 endosymbiont]|nr:hypothetical protein D1AOALGA4SA_7939 [Olavius algarvensis Delta 1 endosymbiont]